MSSNSDPIQNEKKEKELNRLITGTGTPAEERGKKEKCQENTELGLSCRLDTD